MAQRPWSQRRPKRREARVGRVVAVVIGALVVTFLITLAFAAMNWGNRGAGSESSATAPPPATPPGEVAAIDRLMPGECVRVFRKGGPSPNPDGSVEIDHQIVGCDGDDELVYTVATVNLGQQKCPTDTYLEYYQTTAAQGESEAPSDRQYTACLMPNFEAELCYARNTQSVGYRSVACTDPEAVFKVSEVFDVAEAGRCGEGAGDAFVYPVPPRTYCRVPAG